MQTFVAAVVILAMITFGVLLIHQLNIQHSTRISAYHYGRSGTPVPGPDPLTPRKARGRAGMGGTARHMHFLRTARADRTHRGDRTDGIDPSPEPRPPHRT